MAAVCEDCPQSLCGIVRLLLFEDRWLWTADSVGLILLSILLPPSDLLACLPVMSGSGWSARESPP